MMTAEIRDAKFLAVGMESHVPINSQLKRGDVKIALYSQQTLISAYLALCHGGGGGG